MRPPPDPVVRVLVGSTLLLRRVVTGYTPFGPQYERLARRFWDWWDRVRSPLPGERVAPHDPYERWLAVNPWGPRSADQLARRLRSAGSRLPRLSVVMPVHDPPPAILEAALDSVLGQVHDDWELCIADDASRDPEVTQLLERRAAQDGRIRLQRSESHAGIGGAGNRAAALATGEYLAFLDHDDQLHPAALGEVALALAEDPGADLLYTDDDKLDAAGRRHAPQFKPDYSPELLLSHMYFGHLLVVRRRLFEELGGFRAGFDGAQDFDLALRATERAQRVTHVPLVLYHWRAGPGSTATSGDAKASAFAAGERAVAEALSRRRVPAPVERPGWAVRGRLGIYDPVFPDEGPSVVILIPTAQRHDLLDRCLASLRATTYRNYRVVVVDNTPNGADAPRQPADGHMYLPSPSGPFNFSELVNEAAARVPDDLLLFLNDDTEVLAPRWLSQMVGYAALSGVGSVGAKLLFPDGRVQHAGIVHGAHHGLPGHAFKLAAAGDNGYLSLAAVARNCSGVTAACMLTPRRLFLESGGFDAARFPVAYGDADYCYRLARRGYRSVCCASAVLRHHEGASRGFDDDPREERQLRRLYSARSDPYYSPHLHHSEATFELAPRRVVRGPVPPLKAQLWGHLLDRTGAPLHQLELAQALRERLVLEPTSIAVAEGPLRRSYERRRLPLRVRAHPLEGVTEGDYDAAIEALGREMAASGTDVVYANTIETFYAVAAAARAGLPCVWNVHEAEGPERYFARWNHWLARRARACFSLPYRVIFVSEAAREAFARLDSAGRFDVIHNGLHPERVPPGGPAAREAARRALGLAKDQVVFVTVGTVCERKGQHDLARALALLPEPLARSVRVVIVGQRGLPYGRDLETLVARLSPAWRKSVRIVPETDDPRPFFEAADVFVCCSRIESFPRVVLEAMAHGLPILTTPVYGIREQVREGRNALFYPPGDVAALARAMELLAQDATLRRSMAEMAGPVLGTLTTFDEMVESYAEIFREAYLSVS
jgi:glycosyltransferase involved in cell wall biosynthesis